MKNATDLSNTITTQHGVILPSSAKPTISVKAKGKKRQDEDEPQSEQNNSETADVTAEAAADASESSTMDSPMQLAAANTGEEATAGAVQNSAGGAGKSQANDGDANPIWLPLGALALGGIVAGAQGATVAATGGSAAPTTGFSVSGSVVLGPVVAGHNLSVVAFRADGSVLKSGTVNADGTYTLTITENYTGAILLRLIDSADGNDYRDEATGEAQDLTTDLRAVSVVSGPGSYTININPVTELAVRQLNMAGGDNGTSAFNLSGISVADIDTANSNIANALGLDGVNIVTGTVVAAIRADGTANPEANGFGLVLAAISGMESGSDATTDEILSQMAPLITSDAATDALIYMLIAGFASVDSVRSRLSEFGQALGLSAAAASEAAAAWNALLAAADGINNDALKPTQPHYAAIGVSGVDTTAIASLLGDVIDIKSSAAIDSVAELQSLADVVGRLMLHAAGTLQVITQSELESLGVNGLNPARLADLLDKITLSSADGSGIDTLAKLQALVDTAAPSAPTINPVTANNVINSSEREGGVTLTGTCEAGATVTVLLGGVRQTATVTGTTWIYALSVAEVNAMGQGTEAIVLTQTDAAGNTSAQATHTFTVDTVAPVAPTINPVTVDNAINISERDGAGGVILSGICEEGASVTVLLGGVRQTATVTGTTWSYALSVAEVNAMDQGTEAITVTQTDAAGNVSAPSDERVITIDTIAPQNLSIDPVDGLNISNRNAPGGVTITGTCEAGLSLVLTIGGGDRDITPEGTTWSYTLVEEDYELMSFLNARQTLTITQSDDVGNTSSTQLEILADFVAPQAPNSDVVSDDDIITTADLANERGVTITGNLDGDATRLTLQIGNLVREAIVDGLGWSYTLTDADLDALGQGDISIVATASDIVGNVSAPSDERVITIDTIAPQNLSIDPVDGLNISNRNAPGGVTITGTCEAGLSLVLTIGGGDRDITPEGTTWSYTLVEEDYELMSFLNARQTLTITQSDDVGNTSSTQLEILADFVAPEAPSSDVLSDDDIITTADLANERGVTITGNLDGDATRLTLQIGNLVREAIVDGLGWSYTLTDADLDALGQGDISIVATASDIVGNVSAPSDERVITIHTATLRAVSIDQMADDCVSGGDERVTPDPIVITESKVLGAGTHLKIAGLDHILTGSQNSCYNVVQLAGSANDELATLWAACNGSGTEQQSAQAAPTDWINDLVGATYRSSNGATLDHPTLSSSCYIAEAYDSVLHYATLQVL